MQDHPASGSRSAAPPMGGVPPKMPTARHPALYCTPHIKIVGVLTLSPCIVVFDPDPKHPHVKEFGVDQYEVHIDVPDILECGALVMPVEVADPKNSETAYFLQFQVRTLDGRRYCVKDINRAWCVLFRMHERNDLYEAARMVLDSIERNGHEENSKQASNTSIPFPCLDCMSELEARVSQQHQLQVRQEDRCEDRTKTCLSRPSEMTPAEPRLPQVTLRPGNVSHPLLTDAMAECLLDFLPITLRVPGAVEWVLQYTPKAHGVSLSTLFRSLSDYEQSVLVVQDAEDHVFGGFAPQPWEPCIGKFCGSGEAFVFSFGHPGEQPDLRVYPWTMKNSCFMYADNDILAMGGGEGHHAVVVRGDLLHGLSSPTPTFGNPTLAASEEFVVRDLEVWAFRQIE